ADERFLPERIGLTRQIVAFLAEALLDPVLADGTFRADFVAQEAENLRRRIEATINNKPQYAVNRLREEMCRGEPYGLHKYGDVEELRQVTAPRLYEHYRRVLAARSEEHTSELQSRENLVCRHLLEKKKKSDSSVRKRQPCARNGGACSAGK